MVGYGRQNACMAKINQGHIIPIPKEIIRMQVAMAYLAIRTEVGVFDYIICIEQARNITGKTTP